MERRRELIGTIQHRLDTSAIIEEYGVAWRRGKYTKDIEASCCITKFYDFTESSTPQTLVIYGYWYPQRLCMIQKNGVYHDWYGQPYSENPMEFSERTIFYNGANQVSLTLQTDIISELAAWIKESGIVLFAGKNTPYYGYTNINDMPTA